MLQPARAAIAGNEVDSERGAPSRSNGDPMLSNLERRGFQGIGRYVDGQFHLEAAWANRRGVYVWVDPAGGNSIPIRVGIACGKGGFGARYRLYNRWLEGRFKPDDQREQIVRRLTMEGLPDDAEVWGTSIADRKLAIATENQLRIAWAPSLRLDLMVSASWLKQEVAKARLKGFAASEKLGTKVAVRSGSGRRLPAAIASVKQRLDFCPSWVREAFEKLDRICCNVAPDVTVREASRCEGQIYYCGLRQRKFCRIDPNGRRIGVWFHRGILDAVRQTATLRNRTDPGWIYVEEGDPIEPIGSLIRQAYEVAREMGSE